MTESEQCQDQKAPESQFERLTTSDGISLLDLNDLSLDNNLDMLHK